MSQENRCAYVSWYFFCRMTSISSLCMASVLAADKCTWTCFAKYTGILVVLMDKGQAHCTDRSCTQQKPEVSESFEREKQG